jgi:WD40 repeat protein
MVVWHPGGEQLVSCSYDDTIKCWASDGDEWVCTQTLAGVCVCVRVSVSE